MPLKLKGATSGDITIDVPAAAGTNTATFPAATGNVVLDSATQTLTNKTVNGGALQSATSVASTTGTAIDFVNIPSWVRRVTLLLSGVSTNGTSAYLVQLGTSSGVESTGYVGSYGGTQYSSGFFIGSANAANISHTYLCITKLTGDTWVAVTVGALSNTASQASGVGTKPLASTLDRVRLTTVNGTDTFDAGTVNILYE